MWVFVSICWLFVLLPSQTKRLPFNTCCYLFDCCNPKLGVEAMKPLQHKVSDAFSPSKNVSYSPGCVRLFWLCNRCFVSTGRCWIPGKKQNSKKKGKHVHMAVLTKGRRCLWPLSVFPCVWDELLIPLSALSHSLHPAQSVSMSSVSCCPPTLVYGN